MKIFLSGSTSFLGSKFVDLYNDKYEIFGFSRKDSVNEINILDFDKLKEEFYQFQPEVVVHLAAIVDQNVDSIKKANIEGTKNLVKLCKNNKTPIIFMSSESVYGGNSSDEDLKEEEAFNPKTDYAETKVESEKIIKEAGINFLILRAHRFIGINKKYNKPKQFPDALKKIESDEEIHLDSRKLFKPTYITNLCEIFDYYIQNDLDRSLVFNVVVDKTTTFYDLMVDVAKELGLDTKMIKDNGEEKAWPERSTLSIKKLRRSGYPFVSYSQMLEGIKTDYFN